MPLTTFLIAYNRIQLFSQVIICIALLLVYLDRLALSWGLACILLSQLLAIAEVFQAAKGISASNPVTSGIQVAARIGISLVLFVYQQAGESEVILSLGIAWALADAIRCLYYLYKSSNKVAWARYHFFIVLYPIGMTLENIVVWQVLKQSISNPLWIYAPFFIIYLLLAIKMYRHMLFQREKFLLTRKLKH